MYVLRYACHVINHALKMNLSMERSGTLISRGKKYTDEEEGLLICKLAGPIELKIVCRLLRRFTFF